MDFILKLMPPCLFHRLTGFYCPGCGGTRAFIALMSGQFLKSLYYHPLVLYTAVCLTWYLLKRTTKAISGDKVDIPMPDSQVLIYLAVIIVGVNFAIRNILLLLL